eukprot:scaffold1394_cov109-Isochrysis_galbana.AAC.21
MSGLTDVALQAPSSHSQHRLSSISAPVTKRISGEPARNDCSRSHSMAISCKAGWSGHSLMSWRVRSSNWSSTGARRAASGTSSPPKGHAETPSSLDRRNGSDPCSHCQQHDATTKLAPRASTSSEAGRW